jgi:hypothetical protein
VETQLSNSIKMSSIQKRFFLLLALTLVISFSPSKVLGQINPIIFIIGMLLFVRIKLNYHLMLFLLFFLFYTAIGCIYFFLTRDFSFINYYFFAITASSFLVLLLDFRSLLTSKLIERISLMVLLVLLIESIYGLAQGLYGYLNTGSFDISNGDIVRGTIEPGFTPSGLGGNQIFAILVSSLLLFVIATSGVHISKKRIMAILFIVLSWMLASVLHTIIYLLIAIVLAFIFRIFFQKWSWSVSKPALRRAMGITSLVILVCILVPTFLPKNLETFPYFLKYNLSIGPNSKSEKARATYNTLFLLPNDYPFQPIIGIGPGQYSSRASLILTGEYLKGTKIPLPTHINPVTERYILSLFRSFLQTYPNGASSFHPFYSWLSLYGETGILGTAVVILFAFVAITTLSKLKSDDFPSLNFLTITMILYLLILGVHDNYWEFTQAVFPSVLMIKISHDYLVSYGRR